MEEYYKILELQRGASIKEIKDAKRFLLKVWHPDRFEHDPNLARRATEKSAQINNAHDELIEYLKIVREPPMWPKQSPSDDKDESSTQTQYARQQAEQERQQREKVRQERNAKEQTAKEERIAREKAEQERQQREKVRQERNAKEQTAKEERIAREKAEQEIFRQEQRRKAIKTWLFVLCALPIVFLLSWRWFTTTDYAKDIHEWWTDPHYYAPRLTDGWVSTRIPRYHFVLIEPIDEGARIEIRFNGDDQQTAIVTARREFHYREPFLNFSNDNGFVDIRAASPESVGKRYYLKPMHQ